MSLAQSPLFLSTASASSSSADTMATTFCELLAIDDVASCDDVLEFDGEFTPFVTVTAPPPALARSSTYGYEGDVSSYRGTSMSASGYSFQQQLQQPHTPTTMITKSSFYKQASPTGIDTYSPVATNEYAQLAELWSTTSSHIAPVPTSRTSLNSVSDVSFLHEPNDALLDLFMVSPKPAVMSSSSCMAPMPKLTRSVSAPVPKFPPRSSLSSRSKLTKTKGNSKNKKCTYAARRREVSWLRKESLTLEAQLQKLQSKLQERESTRESVDLEKLLLARAHEENERLRAVVMAQEEQIRRSDALFSTSEGSTEFVAATGSAH